MVALKPYIPKDNVKDLEEIPDNVKENLAIHAVETIDEVLGLALENPPEGIEIRESGNESESTTP